MYFNLKQIFNWKKMTKTYIQWFQESFSLDQTSLVQSFLFDNSNVKIQKFNCPEYYIEDFDIYIKDDTAKEQLFQKHEERLEAEKKILFNLLQTAEFQEASLFLTESRVKKMKECIQEIEIQTEVVQMIKSKLQTIFSSCKWFPFSNKNLFDILNSTRLPMISFGNSFWLGVLPEHKNYFRQKVFFESLRSCELPQDSNLILTKLKVSLESVIKKINENEKDQSYINNLYVAFKKNTIKEARDKAFQSWDSINYLNSKMK